MGSELFRQKLHFQSHQPVDDGAGNVQSGPWVTRFTTFARLKPEGRGEEVLAARLTGVQTYRCTVHCNPKTMTITAGWRAVDARNPNRVFSIKSPPANFDENNRWLDMLVEAGVAQ